LNLNVPNLSYSKVKGLAWTRQGFRYYSSKIVKRTDHRGKDYFWVGGHLRGFRKEEGADCLAVDEGFASVTPMRLDCTDYGLLGSAMRGELDR
jgi:5'-nucleotidase